MGRSAILACRGDLLGIVFTIFEGRSSALSDSGTLQEMQIEFKRQSDRSDLLLPNKDIFSMTHCFSAYFLQFRRPTGQRAPRSFGKVVVPSLWCPAFCLGVCRRCAPDLQLQPSDVARRNFSLFPFSLLAKRSDGFRPRSARSPHS